MSWRSLLGVQLWALAVLVPAIGSAHPLGNFSVSQYAGIRLEPEGIELRYVVDMAEIPTFQEIQESGIVPEAGHPGLNAYLARRTKALEEGLRVELNGRRLQFEREGTDVIFPPGAGGLPTMKIGVLYRARLAAHHAGLNVLRYQDMNFPDRAGWKEIVATGGPGTSLLRSSVPDIDRSRRLSNYPTSLLESPPQDLEAHVTFTAASPAPAEVEAGAGAVSGVRLPGDAPQPPTAHSSTVSALPAAPRPSDGARAATEAPAIGGEPLGLQANAQSTPRDAFTELVGAKELSLGIVLVALIVAAGLGAFHALEPGHGKTVVAAYLVGSRGTAWHALVLGLIVTASHTAGVYLLGAVTLYASRFVVPERLYPWLGVLSGLVIAGLGIVLFLRRYAGAGHPHTHGHAASHHHAAAGHTHGPGSSAEHIHAGHTRHAHGPAGAVTLRELFALGVTGGIIPCPAALVVLLSALSLRRIGFGLLLIVAFSVGLAAVLIAIGLLVVYARRFMSRLDRVGGGGSLITRWLPLSSAAVITLLGVAIAVQALLTAGILRVRL